MYHTPETRKKKKKEKKHQVPEVDQSVSQPEFN